jgi:phage tail-like protein
MAVDYQYVPGFYFKVGFIGFEEKELEAKFQEVTGIQAEVETEDVREGGENRFVHHLPKGAKFPNLVLKRALYALPSHIVKWAEDAINNFDFRLHQIVVSLLNKEGEPVKSWKFVDVYPVKIQISDLNAKENSLVIETLELAYKYSQSVSLGKMAKNKSPDISDDHVENAGGNLL